MSVPIQKISTADPSYPSVLHQLTDPPKHLFVQGSLEYPFEKSIAIVGTRQCTSYALLMCEQIVKTLCAYGFYIISGLAYGVDIHTARMALKYGGKTMAIVGGGIDHNVLYPKEHRQVAQQIVHTGGCLLSEYEPTSRPAPHQFVARNRLIACLSKSTLVLEAPTKSGSLITTDFATQLGRDVMAIPGDIKKICAGSNQLLQNGAHMILSGEDILSLYGIHPSGQKSLIV